MTTSLDLPLKQILMDEIAASGPISLASYMSTCLLHPEYGYYMKKDPLGAAGDFITAPEISQMFGELVGLHLAQAWLDQGAPQPFLLTELGPGRGTLMADALHATRKIPGFHEAMQIALVEVSEALHAVQSETLSTYAPNWYTSVEDLPNLPLFLIANEYFDALTIRQFERSDQAWRERVVGIKKGDLCLGLTDPKPVPEIEHRLEDTKPGDIVEISHQAIHQAGFIGQQIAKNGGAALIIDYGDWGSQGDTFQAVINHERTNPFEKPGAADLTAHVDFEALAQAAAPARYSQLTTQGIFLERLGITARAQAIAASLSGDTLETHIAAHRRLTHPTEMGTLFKVLSLTPEGAPPPPGLNL